MSQDTDQAVVPKDLEEVMISRATGWSYWEIVTQPTWFLDRLMLYMRAETVAQRIREQRAKSQAESKFRRR